MFPRGEPDDKQASKTTTKLHPAYIYKSFVLLGYICQQQHLFYSSFKIPKQLTDFTHVLGIDDDNERAYFYRGVAYLNKGEFLKDAPRAPDNGDTIYGVSQLTLNF